MASPHRWHLCPLSWPRQPATSPDFDERPLEGQPALAETHRLGAQLRVVFGAQRCSRAEWDPGPDRKTLPADLSVQGWRAGGLAILAGWADFCLEKGCVIC